MSRTRSFLAVPFLALALVGGGQVASAADSSPAPAGFDCATDGLHWPERESVQGATFTGVVVGGYRVNFARKTYRLRVAREYAGEFGSHVRISVQCVDTEFSVGARLLVSSGRFFKKDGVIARVVFNDDHAVAWRVTNSSGNVKLRGYGDGLERAPTWAANPDTVRQAVRAVTPS